MSDQNDPDGLARDLEVARGSKLAGLTKRGSAERIWRSIAEGEAHASTKLAWVEHVAEKLAKELILNRDLDERLRGSRALYALGLQERIDKYAGMRLALKSIISFRNLDDPADTEPPRPEVLHRMLLDMGHLDNCGNKANQKKVIARELAKVLAARCGDTTAQGDLDR